MPSFPSGVSSASTNFCQVAPSLLPYNHAFGNDRFFSTVAIGLGHRVPPRYGNTENVTLLVLGNKADQQSYFRGLAGGASTILAFFVVWVCLLIYFRIRGPHRYGWLSGSRTPLPPNPHGSEEMNDLSLSLGEANEEVVQDSAGIQEKISGTDKTGSSCLVGQGHTDTAKKEENEDGFSKWIDTCRAKQRQNRRMKGVVFASALCIIVAEILMVTKG